jgi:hypothetical protein
MYPSKIVLGLMMVVATISLQAQSVSCFVLSKVHASDQWKSYPTRVLSDFPSAVTDEKDSNLSEYGGLIERKVNATGFFYTTNLDGRWWLVDPDGCLFLDRGVSDVERVRGAESKQVLAQEFGNETNWAVQTTALLRSNGFNNLGAWSDIKVLRPTAHPLVYTRILNFMSSYGEQRGGTYQQPGHTGYPNNCIFVFDPAFEKFCDVYARQVAQTKTDSWLLGYFSDNEMPLWRGMLTNYLRLPSDDAGYRAALEWLQARHGKQATINDATEQDKEDFLAFVVGRYYRIVSYAIKKYDPNHLFLGSRFNGRVLSEPEVFKAAGPYLDVVSANYYDVWTPSQEKLISWERESGKPVLITEWYTKAEDSGLANTGGAGWIVKTQRDRGLFYQNYTLALLQSKVCVGWDWFKYADNDPTDTTSDPSNRDANKGIVNVHYQPYQPLLEAMRQVNERVYCLATYFDSSAGSIPYKETADNTSMPFKQN